MTYIKHMNKNAGVIGKITCITRGGAHYIDVFDYVYTAEMLEKVR